MSFSDSYEFDPRTYGVRGAGGLLGRMQAMLQQGQTDPNPDSNTVDAPVYDSEAYAGQQGGLVGRLRALQQEQAEFRPQRIQSRNGLVDQIVGAESSGNPNAANERSTARGAGQFLEGTWLEMLAKHRPDLTGSRQQLLALRNDPTLATEMTEAYAADNAKKLAKAGYQATPGNIYLTHFAGPSGAVAVLNADPNASVSSVLARDVMAANPFLSTMTIGDMRAWADRKMRPTSVRPSRPAPSAFPERADPIFPRQASPQAEGRSAQTSPNDQSWLLNPSPIASQLGGGLTNDQISARQPLLGLVSGKPMQYWGMPIFGRRR